MAYGISIQVNKEKTSYSKLFFQKLVKLLIIFLPTSHGPSRYGDSDTWTRNVLNDSLGSAETREQGKVLVNFVVKPASSFMIREIWDFKRLNIIFKRIYSFLFFCFVFSSSYYSQLCRP